jgi:hypothetical protein
LEIVSDRIPVPIYIGLANDPAAHWVAVRTVHQGAPGRIVQPRDVGYGNHGQRVSKPDHNGEEK